MAPQSPDVGSLPQQPSEDQGIAITPAPPYTAVIFTSRRALGDGAEYGAMAVEMDRLARLQPGYLGIEGARGADRVGITVSYWTSPETARDWKQVTEHLGAQRLGRDRWYADYRVRIATVEREYGPANGPL
jgi:heme-degrading monooxygenase HmoA